VSALSRRQQEFKSPWGRQIENKVVRELAAFFIAGVKGSCPFLIFTRE
jgi:hypothetical protein